MELTQTQNNKIIAFSNQFFLSAILQVTIDESFADRRTYSVNQEGVKSLGKVFEALERRNIILHIAMENDFISWTVSIPVKTDFEVEEYSFGQTTLEQVFIKFAKEQEVSEETPEVLSTTLW